VTAVVRPARTRDVAEIRRLIDEYAPQRILLDKAMVTLYEDVQEFLVADAPGADADPDADRPRLVGCGALHVMWEDLAEVRTLAVDPAVRGQGVGHALLEELLDRARALGVHRLFCLTFEVDFFGRHGFCELDGSPVAPAVYDELLRSYDEGVAEFLGLEHVKPNILGNTRMVLEL
jgi:amino-acid N-acetyltransferase